MHAKGHRVKTHTVHVTAARVCARMAAVAYHFAAFMSSSLLFFPAHSSKASIPSTLGESCQVNVEGAGFGQRCDSDLVIAVDYQVSVRSGMFNGRNYSKSL